MKGGEWYHSNWLAGNNGIMEDLGQESTIVRLKVHGHKIFGVWFFSSIYFPLVCESMPLSILIYFANSRRYLSLNIFRRCQSVPVSLIPEGNFSVVSRIPIKMATEILPVSRTLRTFFSGVNDTGENFVAVSLTPLQTFLRCL